MEVDMGSYKHPRFFLPIDLQIVELVYDAAWTQIVQNDPFRDTDDDDRRKTALRKRVFRLADDGPVDYDALLEKVVNSSPESGAIFFRAPTSSSSTPRAN